MEFKDKFIFGTASLHHLIFQKRIFSLLDYAYSIGFRTFDTSPYYGLGYNEYLLLKWIYKRNKKDVLINTKEGLSYPFFRSTTIFAMIIQKPFSYCGLKGKKDKEKNIYKRFHLNSSKILLHEPSLKKLKNDNILTEFDGVAGELASKSDAKFQSKIRQVPFKFHPKGDIFYGIYSGEKKFDVSLKGVFIYYSSKKFRLKKLKESYEKIYG